MKSRLDDSTTWPHGHTSWILASVAAPAAVMLVALAGCTAERTTSVGEAPASAETRKATGPPVVTAQEAAKSHPDFRSYWYQGLAELDRYELEQSRYGEIHQGEAVLIFVTEDFKTDKLVKHEFGPKENVAPVLKTNAYRRFYTGVYPYTLLTSVFTPTAKAAEPLKVSSTTQEWCGHAFMQIGRTGDEFQAEIRSYFQAEGDDSFNLAVALLEDGIWNHIRISPQTLPTGNFEMIPASHALRMLHKPLKAYPAEGRMEEVGNSPYGDAAQWKYTIAFEGMSRAVTWYVEKAFPHRVLGWEEAGVPPWGPKHEAGQRLVTKARLTQSIMLDYWSRNGVADAGYRDSLGLEY